MLSVYNLHPFKHLSKLWALTGNTCNVPLTLLPSWSQASDQISAPRSTRSSPSSKARPPRASYWPPATQTCHLSQTSSLRPGCCRRSSSLFCSSFQQPSGAAGRRKTWWQARGDYKTGSIFNFIVGNKIIQKVRLYTKLLLFDYILGN